MTRTEARTPAGTGRATATSRLTQRYRERHPKGFGQPWKSPNGGRTARYEKAGRGGWRKKCRGGHGGGEGREDKRRARRTSGPHRPRADTAPAGHFETFAKNASYMGGLREGWIEKHSNKEEATGGTGGGCSDVTHTHAHKPGLWSSRNCPDSPDRVLTESWRGPDGARSSQCSQVPPKRLPPSFTATLLPLPPSSE